MTLNLHLFYTLLNLRSQPCKERLATLFAGSVACDSGLQSGCVHRDD